MSPAPRADRWQVLRGQHEIPKRHGAMSNHEAGPSSTLVPMSARCRRDIGAIVTVGVKGACVRSSDRVERYVRLCRLYSLALLQGEMIHLGRCRRCRR